MGNGVAVAGLLAAIAALFGGAEAAGAQQVTKAEFTQHFADALRQAEPGVTVDIAGDLELHAKAGPEGRQIFLDNAYRNYLLDPSSEKKVIEQYVASFKAIDAPAPVLDRAQIMPVIKTKDWVDSALAAAKAQGGKPAELVMEDFSGGLVVVYAQDTPSNMAFLTPGDLGKLGLKPADLRQIAVANLAALPDKIGVKRGPLVSIVVAGGTYEASLLLLTDFWKAQAAKVDGEIVAAIPARDLLLFTGSKNTVGVAKLAALATEMLAKSSYGLTNQLYIFRKGRFQPYAQ